MGIWGPVEQVGRHPGTQGAAVDKAQDFSTWWRLGRPKMEIGRLSLDCTLE